MRFAQQIAKDMKGTVLDVPCGYGRNAKLMSSLGCRVICLDNNPAAITTIKNDKLRTAGELVPMLCDSKKSLEVFS